MLPLSQWHSKTNQELTQQFGVNPEKGLSNQEAATRLTKYGKNSLVHEREIRFLGILREEITEPMILLLISVGVLYSILGSLTDALTIIVIIILLVLAEVWNEYRAKRSVSALKQLAPPTASVLRAGQLEEVQTALLVPGDILLLKVGQRIPADAKLLETYGLEVDESSFTGESFPTAKDALTVLPNETRVNYQINMLFTGTIITKGRAKAIVTSTGINTELGRISGITNATKEPKTAMQLAMKQLSKSLVWVALFFSVLIPILSYVRGVQPNPAEAVLYGLSLAFVVIPEELPIIVTMVLGVGSYALSRKGAIVKQLRAAETLGNVTVIATDKTGTITENKMLFEQLYFDDKVSSSSQLGENQKAALKTAFLASDAIRDVANKSEIANPMSQAISERLFMDGKGLSDIAKGWVLEDELSFDAKRKIASYIYKYSNSLVLLSSGAPEKILEKSSRILLLGEETALTEETRKRILNTIDQMAKNGERLLAFGYRRMAEETAKDDLEIDLVFVGIVGFVDPPREGVKDAIRICHEAGIRVIMITGDYPQTARAIAHKVGIDSSKVLTGSEIEALSDSQLKETLDQTFVFARATPEDKLRLVRLLKEKGEVVAVTGDGINDAPALKNAHIGIAMGIRGTDVAKEASNMILTNDNFATIENAVAEGRKLFSNLRKGIRYYLSCKAALVSIFIIPIVLGIPLPFAPIQIIVLELFMDLAASATFVAEPLESGSMKKPPASLKEKFFNSTMLKTIFLGALSLFAAVTITYLFAWYTSQNITYARTVAFATWMLGHVFLALNLRSDLEPLLKQSLLSNKVMIIWALLAVTALVLCTLLPLAQTSLQITSLNIQSWVLIFLTTFTAMFWIEIKKILRK